MIPRCIKLSGFLCYKDEQEIAFDGSSLWMLAGLNGSGKSSVFDAVTYALFGHHRGGATSAGELINKDSKSLSVEFEFLAEGDIFRIQRSLRRDPRGTTKGTQNIYRFDDASKKWVGVPDTNLSDGFKAWVRDHIGLNYETFTSSVLLLQGRAEKLLDSSPRGRADVLSGIVDLERYQKLHEKADAKRKALKAKLETIQGQITGVPEVSDIELVAAENRIDEAEHLTGEATKEVERLQNLEFESRKWNELQVRLSGLQSRWDKAKSIVAESATIEKAYTRLRELKEVIPHLLVIQEKQRASDESTRATTQLNTLKEQSVGHREEIEHAIDVARKKRTSHQKTLMQDEQKLEATREKRSKLAGPLSQLGIYEEQLKKLKSVNEQLVKLPKDIDAQLQQAQLAFDRCMELGTVVPLLDRFAAVRLQLRDSTQRSEELQRIEQTTREVGEKAKVEHAKLKTTLDATATARQQADRIATEAKTLAQQAKAAADEFEKLEGAKTCRTCGQALTPAHWELEKGKRIAEWQTAMTRNREATAAQSRAVAAEKEVRDQCDAAERELQRLREEYRDAKKDRELAIKDIERLTLECRNAYLALPDAYRSRVSKQMPNDWTQTTWPNADEQRSIKNEAAELENARRRATELRDKKSQADKLSAEREAASGIRDQIQSQLPSGDPSKLREDDAKLKAEENALNDSLRSIKKLMQDTDIEIEQHNKKLTEVQKTIGSIDSQLSVEEEKRTAHVDAIERASRMIPATWREPVAKAGLAEQNRWKAELETLVREGTESRFQELTQTRASIEQVQQDIALTQEAANAIVEDARRPVDDFKSLLTTAKKLVGERAAELQKAREEKAVLDRHRAERERLRGQSLSLEKDLNFNVLLTQLLGRDRLQRHLVRTAEKQIVDYANSILDRLSGGQLFLRLCGSDDGGTERALELEAYNRMTGSTPINVAFLSGSQRFRVAVSLALGIGQYASRQHRPIESVIIDEGFGCLDRNGRQVMIQELQNLRGHLKCILLVSHQEEFADAFADGYRFELTDGATRVSRFQK